MRANVFTSICKSIAAALPLCVLSAHAQNYPTKPVRIIAAAAGAGADIFSRQLAPTLSERLHQPVVVENRPGASSTIAASSGARATPDGYTLYMGDIASLATAVSLHKITYDPIRDFAPITLVAATPLILVAHPALPAMNLRELAAHAKKHPGMIRYASGSTGSPGHLTSALFAQLAQVDLIHVPYKGGGAALMAVLTREVEIASISATVGMPQIKAGKVKALAVAAKNRLSALPEVLTGPEAGLPGFESAAWFGIVAPARTPSIIVERLNRDIVEIMQTPAMQASLLAQGAEAMTTSAQEFLGFIKSEIAKWKRVIEVSGARLE